MYSISVSTYENLPRPRGEYDIEFLEALKYEVEIAISMLDMDSGLDSLTSGGVDVDRLEGEELDQAIERLHEQVSRDPEERAHLRIREEELVRLKATIEELLRSA